MASDETQPFQPPVYLGSEVTAKDHAHGASSSSSSSTARPSLLGASSSHAGASRPSKVTHAADPRGERGKKDSRDDASSPAMTSPGRQRRKTMNDRLSLKMWRAKEQGRLCRTDSSPFAQTVSSEKAGPSQDAAHAGITERSLSEEYDLDEDDHHLFRASSAPPYEHHQAPPSLPATFGPASARPPSPAFPSAALSLRQTLTYGDGPDPRAIYISFEDYPAPHAAAEEEGKAAAAAAAVVPDHDSEKTLWPRSRRSSATTGKGAKRQAPKEDTPLQDPQKWSLWKKWSMLAPCFAFTMTTAVNATGYRDCKRL